MIILNWLSTNLLPSKPDPRLDDYPLMSSWTPTAIISLIYVIGVYAWKVEHIKRYRNQYKNKEEYNTEMKNSKLSSRSFIKQLMILYNVIMVIYSGVITLGILWSVYTLGYGLGCEEQPDPNDTKYDTFVWTGYLFYFSKFVEMLDTVFFLLRGKVDQVTFLHVFHHATMPPSIWWGVKYAPGGIVFMFPLVNSFIHVIMYAYYGLAAAEAYRYLWWKNYLTLAQMIQFIILILHQGQIFFLTTPCNYPKVFPAAIVLYASVFLVLFSNFYIKAYWHKQRLAKSLAQQQHHHQHQQSQQQQNGHFNGKLQSNEYGSTQQINGYTSSVVNRLKLNKSKD